MAEKIYIHTYGCQMNERDSERVSSLLARHGHVITANEDEADVVIVNTCSVRGKAEDKALGKLGLLTSSRSKGRPSLVVGVMGCMAQRMKDTIFSTVKGLDFIAGTSRFSSIPAMIDAVRAGHGPVIDVSDEKEENQALSSHIEGKISAFVTILLGCDRRCAYCIVPDVRGAEWSRAGNDVIKEVQALAAQGVKEITLLGQSVMSYGRKNAVWPAGYISPGNYKEPLPRLLEALANAQGLERLRFTSGHPSGCTPELARSMSELQPVCEHIHMPVQSGSDRILKMMNRGYLADDYRKAVATLKTAMPDMAITTDVIVGFPSETEKDFEMTREFFEEISFDNAFIFKYSPRPGTPASNLPDDVPEDEKMRRNQILLKDQDRIGMKINNRLVGSEIEALVEGPSLRNSERWSGRTRTNKTVVFDSPDKDDNIKPGHLIKLKIERAMPQTLYGVVNKSMSI